VKQFVLLISAIASLTQLCRGASCVSGTLASYIALGATGCTIGANNLSGFQTLSGLAGAISVSPADVTITPNGGALNPGITVGANASAAAGMQLELLFTYRISGNSYTGISINLADSRATGDGAVSDVNDYCAGGMFGPDGVSGCSGTAGSLVLLNSGSDLATFSAVPSLNVTDDLTFDGGTMGSAAGGSITDRFTAVPEPFTVLLTAAGIALALGLRLTKRNL